MPPLLKCPICGKKVSFNDPDMPFCSDRCRVADLANWADEKYAIGSSAANELEELEDRDDRPQHEGREQ